MAFVKPSAVSGGQPFFKPKDHRSAHALLIEPTRIDRDVPNTYKGVTKNRDEVIADVTIFATEAELASGKPSTELKNAKITNSMLTRAAERVIGGAMAARLNMIDTQAGSGYVFDDLNSADEGLVEKFYDAREAAVSAAVDAAPDF